MTCGHFWGFDLQQSDACGEAWYSVHELMPCQSVLSDLQTQPRSYLDYDCKVNGQIIRVETSSKGHCHYGENCYKRLWQRAECEPSTNRTEARVDETKGPAKPAFFMETETIWKISSFNLART